MENAAAAENETEEAPTAGDQSAGPLAGNRFSRLPDRVLPEDMVEEVTADTAKDPDFGRDPDRDWLLRTT